MNKQPNQSEIVLYTTTDGKAKIDTIFQNETIWLTQKKMAELFDVGRPAIKKHLKNIFESRELDEKVVSSILEHTAQQTNYFQFGNSSNNIRDIYATAIDYNKTTEQAQIFFKDVN